MARTSDLPNRKPKLYLPLQSVAVRWSGFSFAAIAIAVYTLGATLHALAIVNPVVIQDEYVYYISGVNFTDLDLLYTNAPELPRFNNYIYFALIHIVSRVINGADSAVKLLQVASLGVTAWAVTALTYRSINEKVSRPSDSNQFLLLLVLLLWPSNTYAVFVMPDLLYFNLFLLAFSLTLSTIRSWQGQVAALGSTAGLLMHVKPHAAFLFPGLLAAIVSMKLMRWSSTTAMSLLKAIVIAFASFGGVFALTRGLFRLAVTLPGGNLVGSSYANYVTNTLADLYRTLPNLAPLHLNFLASTLMIVGPCLIYVLWALFRSTRCRAAGALEVPARYAFASVFCVICWMVLVGSLPMLIYGESSRINLRYLAFTFPGFVVSAVLLQRWVRSKVQEGNAEWEEPPHLKWIMALTWSVAAVYLAWHVDQMTLLFVDAPDLYSLDTGKTLGNRSMLRSKMPWVSASIIIVASGGMILQPQRWLRTYMLATVVLFFFATLNVASAERRISNSLREFRGLGELASLRCPNPEKTMFLATRHSYVPLYSAAFGFKGPAHFLFVANGAADEVEKAVVGAECIIAPFGILAQVKPRRVNVRGLELQW
jgi:hypothetical protein